MNIGLNIQQASPLWTQVGCPTPMTPSTTKAWLGNENSKMVALPGNHKKKNI